MNETGVTFIIQRPSGEILIQQRDDGRGEKIPYPNTWCFPGGTKESNEDYLTTAIREIKEEYDLDVQESQCNLITVYNHDDIISDHVYFCEILQGAKPKLLEGKDMRWKTIQEIKEMKLAWQQDKIIIIIEKHLATNLK